MTDNLERRLRSSLHGATLPSAPDALYARLGDLAASAPRPRPLIRGWQDLGRPLALIGAALLLLGALAVAAVGSRPPERLSAVVESSPGTSPNLPAERIGDLVHVTGGQAAVDAGLPFGGSCSRVRCQIGSNFTASDDRLSGGYLFEPTGSTPAGTWGIVGMCPVGTEPPCSYYWQDFSKPAFTWVGEWFTSGARPLNFLQGAYASPDGGYPLLPVDTIWLHGRGPNAGLTAVLRMWSEGSGGGAVDHLDGWVFPAPSTDPTNR